MASLSQKSFWASVAALSLPVAAQMLLQALLGMADVMMVARLETSAVAAVGLAAKIHFLLLVTMTGLATGCSVLVAQYSGAGDDKGVRRTVAITLLTGVAAALPVVLLFAIQPQWWVAAITPDDTVSRMTARYLQITALALLFTQLIVIYEGALRALGNATMPLCAGVLAVAINLPLNYLLIFGHFGFPAMGVAGAAAGTLIARAIQLAAILAWIYGRRHHYAMRPACLIGYAANGQQVVRFWRFALPLIANHAIWAFGNTAYHVITGFAGTQALAVLGAIVPIESGVLSLFIGLANASAVMIGRALGADDSEGAWRLYGIFTRLTLAMVLALSLSVWIARPWLLQLFGDMDDGTRALLSQTLTLFCVLLWLKAANIMHIIGTLRAGGDNRFCLAMDAAVMWLFGVPAFGVAVFVFNLSFLPLYALIYLEDLLKLVPVILRVHSRQWMINLARRHGEHNASPAKAGNLL